MDNQTGKAKRYDSTVARIAGNLLSGAQDVWHEADHKAAANLAVKLARAIVAEVERTEPKKEDNG